MLWSLPSWECGLKWRFRSRQNSLRRVTPLVGVWIEIAAIGELSESVSVTPLVGVWIEIGDGTHYGGRHAGHSPRGSVD